MEQRTYQTLSVEFWKWTLYIPQTLAHSSVHAYTSSPQSSARSPVYTYTSSTPSPCTLTCDAYFSPFPCTLICARLHFLSNCNKSPF